MNDQIEFANSLYTQIVSDDDSEMLWLLARGIYDLTGNSHYDRAHAFIRPQMHTACVLVLSSCKQAIISKAAKNN